jgi:hypothetical protein
LRQSALDLLAMFVVLALLVVPVIRALPLGPTTRTGILAWLLFRDRFRCNEAFSSRFCSGLMNLSMLYVPFISLAYGVSRGLAKLSR